MSKDQLLFVFEISRHGARTGLHKDMFNTSWVPGELTNSGARQHYLVGKQLRHRYIDELQFLSDTYNPNEIYVRSTDYNRTIESATSQMLGLYPPSSNDLRLHQNQSDVVPPFNISSEILQKTQQDLGDFALPFNLYPIPVHTYDLRYDIFQPHKFCPIVAEEVDRRLNSSELIQQMDSKYQNALQKYAQLINLNQQSINFDSKEMWEYSDSVWSRYFDQYLMGNLTQDLINQASLFKRDYFGYAISQNETIRKIFITGVLTELVLQNRYTIDQDLNGNIKDSIDRLKFFYYSDHDDCAFNIGDAFEYFFDDYPPFASVIIFELWKLNSEYYINMTINDKQVSLKGPCKGKDKCKFGDFADLVKQISFFENEKEYMNICGEPEDIYYQEKIDLEDILYTPLDSERENKYQKKRLMVVDYNRFFIAYGVVLSISLLGWTLYNKVWLRRKSSLNRV